MLAGIDAALDAGLDPVKVNCVVMRGVNDDEVVDLAAFGREQGRRRALHRVHAPRRRRRVDARPGRRRRTRSSSRIDAVFPLERGAGRGAARRARRAVPLPRRRGDVGVIPASPSRSASSCDRVRLTAEGKLRTCLFALDETTCAAILRGRRRPTTTLAAAIEARGRHQVGRPPHRPGRLRPPRPVDEPDRRLSARIGPDAALLLDSAPMTDLGVHPPRPARAGPGWSTSPPKEPTHRRAVARCRVHMEPETTSQIARGAITKGDVLAVARVAGIQAAKRTPDLHPAVPPAAGRARCS